MIERPVLWSVLCACVCDSACHAQVHLDDSFDVDGVGTVVAGTIRRGRIQVGDSVLLGPDRATGAFHPVVIRWVVAM